MGNCFFHTYRAQLKLGGHLIGAFICAFDWFWDLLEQITTSCTDAQSHRSWWRKRMMKWPHIDLRTSFFRSTEVICVKRKDIPTLQTRFSARLPHVLAPVHIYSWRSPLFPFLSSWASLYIIMKALFWCYGLRFFFPGCVFRGRCALF